MEPSLLTGPGFERFLRDLLQPVLALGLAAARPLGLALVFPVFTRAELGGVLRAGLALGLSLPMIWTSTATVGAMAPGNPVPLALLALKEILVGTLLGFLLGLPFWAIQSVGELMDTQRGVGSEMAGIDPTTRSQGSVMSLFLGLAGAALFVAADGLQTVAGTLYDSYAVWPQASFAPRFTFDTALAAVGGLDHILRFALLVGGPVVALLLLIDLSVMLIGRSAPQLNANDLAPTIKNVVFIVFIALYATYLVDYMRAELASTIGLAERLRAFVGP